MPMRTVPLVLAAMAAGGRRRARRGRGASTFARPGSASSARSGRRRRPRRDRQTTHDRGPFEECGEGALDAGEVVDADELAGAIEADEVPDPREGRDVGD